VKRKRKKKGFLGWVKKTTCFGEFRIPMGTKSQLYTVAAPPHQSPIESIKIMTTPNPCENPCLFKKLSLFLFHSFIVPITKDIFPSIARF
jgi:hypothetical protein